MVGEMMVKAFSKVEKEMIKEKLKAAAKECVGKYGMKKTTVDELVECAEISKGAFYKFYETKEMLFFEMLEDLHLEVYGKALETLKINKKISEKERLVEAFLEAIRVMEENNMMDFLENELYFLLRKIPEKVKETHYHSDDYHIKELMDKSGFEFLVTKEVAAGAVRALILTISHKKEIGESYKEVMELLVRGICDRLVK